VVLEAARRLLLEEGQEAVTPVRISEMTGVARTTIYRHWPDRTRLLLEVLSSEEPDHAEYDTGNLREDLIGLLGHMARRINRRPAGRFLAAMAERAEHHPEAAALRREHMTRLMRPLRQILEAGIASGALPAHVDLEASVARLAGPVFFQRLLARGRPDERLIANVVDTFLAAPVAE
jgi:AcrR family transcriptional regulator